MDGKPDTAQCTAIASRSGKRCQNKAKLRGKCIFHGGKPKVKVNTAIEAPIIGLRDISAYLGITPTTLQARYQTEMADAGVLLLRTDLPNIAIGNAGRRTAYWSWPSLIQRWVILRGGIGQHLGRACAKRPDTIERLDKAGFKRAKNPADGKNKRESRKLRHKPFKPDTHLAND